MPEQQSTLFSAKSISKAGYVIAIIWTFGMSLLKALSPILFGKTIDLTMLEIILAGFSFVIFTSPITANIIIDKYLNRGM